MARVSIGTGPDQRQQLLDFAFFVDHVLANDRIEFLDFHLAGHGTLVLTGRIKMTGSR